MAHSLGGLISRCCFPLLFNDEEYGSKLIPWVIIIILVSAFRKRNIHREIRSVDRSHQLLGLHIDVLATFGQ